MGYDIRFEGELTEEEQELKRLLELSNNRQAALALWREFKPPSMAQRLRWFANALATAGLINPVEAKPTGRNYDNKALHLME